MRTERKKITKPVVRKFAARYNTVRLRKAELEAAVAKLEKESVRNEALIFATKVELEGATLSYNLFVQNLHFNIKKFAWAA